jgi:hypothetical protein
MPSAPTASPVQSIPPVAQIAGERLDSFVFSPDGRMIYIHQAVPVLDLWVLAVSHWPEVLAAALALLAMVTGALALRIIRSPQTPGIPYCARCNYELSGDQHQSPSAANRRCPECGVSLARRPPRRGRERWRRLAPLALVLFIGAAAYATMLVSSLPRDGRAAQWLDLTSATLAAAVHKYDLQWLIERCATGDRIRIVDVERAEVIGTLATRRSHTRFPLAISPDGHSLFIAGRAEKSVQRISARSGRTLSTATFPGAPYASLPPAAPVFSFSDCGSVAYVQWFERSTVECGVSAWSLRSGHIETVVTTPGFESGPEARWRNLFGRSFIRHPSRPAFLSFGWVPRSSRRSAIDIRWHSAGESQVFREPFQRAVPGHLTLSPDGTLLYIPGHELRTISIIDMESGADLEPFVVGDLGNFLMHAWPSSDGAMLLVPGMGHSPQLLGARCGTRLAAISMPENLRARDMSFSPDGRWIAARCVSDDARMEPAADLVIWRVDSLRSKLPKSLNADPDR